MFLSKLIQKHFRKMAVGVGLGIAGATQYFPKLGKINLNIINIFVKKVAGKMSELKSKMFES